MRKKVGEYFLRQEMRGRTREVKGTGLTTARSIGIIFHVKDEQAFKLIREFSDKLRVGGRQVKTLGFVPRPEEASYLRAGHEFDFFNRDDLNWYYRPTGRKVLDFMDEPFDILIDLRLNSFLPLLFPVGLSKARFKVGSFGKDHEDFYDLMIDIDPNSDVPYFIGQIQHYLKMLEVDKK